jgi:hypothetical protein
MKIKLTNETHDYLAKNNKFASKIISIKSTVNNKILTAEADEADEIREWALEKLPRVGFDHNYSLNKEGKILEEIINSFLT